MKHKLTAAAALVIGLLAGAPVAHAWEMVVDGQPFVQKDGLYTIQFPSGWRWLKQPGGDGSAASRDGLPIQYIIVEFRKHKKAFRALKQDSSPELMPQELAEKVLADETASGSLQNVEMLANEPATLAGHPAFRLEYEYKQSVDTGSVRFREVVIGSNSPQGIYLVSYRAPVLHFFERDRETFEKTLATFAFSDKPR